MVLIKNKKMRARYQYSIYQQDVKISFDMYFCLMAAGNHSNFCVVQGMLPLVTMDTIISHQTFACTDVSAYRVDTSNLVCSNWFLYNKNTVIPQYLHLYIILRVKRLLIYFRNEQYAYEGTRDSKQLLLIILYIFLKKNSV